MVVLALLATGAGVAAGAAVVKWQDVTKPFIEKQIASLVGKLGPNALGGSKCELAQVSLTLGSVTTIVLSGLKVFNLPPYSENELMIVDKIVIVVDVSETMKCKVREVKLPKLSIEGCHLTWEKDLLSSNVKTLLDKLKSKEAEDEAKAAKTQKEERKVILDEVSITGVKVKAGAHVMEGVNVPGVPVPVPDIRIKNFSGKYGEVTLDKLIVTIFTDIFRGATDALGSVLSQGKAVVESTVGAVADEASSLSSWFASWFGPSS